ncbi:hypothetical protein [Paenibacillus profundus]|nr:hypothetical protein [Paenibacillus profundus]
MAPLMNMQLGSAAASAYLLEGSGDPVTVGTVGAKLSYFRARR